MSTIGSVEAKAHLNRLLDRVQRGEQITITRHGSPVARLVPAGEKAQPEPEDLIQELRRFQKGRRLGKASLRQWIKEGRKH